MARKRAERVGPLIREEIARILLTRLDDPGLRGITLTRVKMSADLKIAHVYFSVIGGPEPVAVAAAALERASGVFKRALAENLELRCLPGLEFHYDRNLDHADRIERILRQIHHPEPPTGQEEEP